jgi:hypothetical protein
MLSSGILRRVTLVKNQRFGGTWAFRSSETSVLTTAIRRNIPEDDILHGHCLVHCTIAATHGWLPLKQRLISGQHCIPPYIQKCCCRPSTITLLGITTRRYRGWSIRQSDGVFTKTDKHALTERDPNQRFLSSNGPWLRPYMYAQDPLEPTANVRAARTCHIMVASRVVPWHVLCAGWNISFRWIFWCLWHTALSHCDQVTSVHNTVRLSGPVNKPHVTEGMKIACRALWSWPPHERWWEGGEWWLDDEDRTKGE